MIRVDFTPASPWRYVIGERVVGVRITPKSLTVAIIGGRLEPYTITVMIVVVETAKILNRITDKPEHHGA